MAATVANLEVLQQFEGHGKERKLVGYLKNIKLWGKNLALAKLMKHHGLYERDSTRRSENLQLPVASLSLGRCLGDFGLVGASLSSGPLPALPAAYPHDVPVSPAEAFHDSVESDDQRRRKKSWRTSDTYCEWDRNSGA